MTLQNWLENRDLKTHQTSNEEIWNLRELVERNLADAAVEDVSLDNRLGVLFMAALALCRIALHASGYRMSNTSRHHELMVRSLVFTLGPEWQGTASVFDQARRNRAKMDYETVGTATQSTVAALRAEVEKLLQAMEPFLRTRGYRLY